MPLTKVASTEPKLSKILKKTIKKALSNEGIAPSTRSGNKELDLLIRKIAKQSPTIEQVTATAEKIATTIVHLSKQQGKTALDRGIIRQIAFDKDFTSLIVVPLTEVVAPAIATTKTEAIAVPPNPVVEEPEIEETAAELAEELEIESEPEIEETDAELAEELEIESEPEIEEPDAESTEELEIESEPEIEEPAAELTEEAEIESEEEIEEPAAELTEELEIESEEEIEEPAAELTEEEEIEEPAAELTEEGEIEEEEEPLPIATKSKPLTRAN